MRKKQAQALLIIVLILCVSLYKKIGSTTSTQATYELLEQVIRNKESGKIVSFEAKVIKKT